MSTFAVTAERLTILPHPNADALELAAVGGYRAVVAKDKYRTGDFALYIPEQAILPEALIEELGLTGRLAGKAANRVKAVRLRGELSQGIVCRPAAVAGYDLAVAYSREHDFAPELGISKWIPEVPANMSGEMIAAPRLLPWIEVENIKRYPDIFAVGEPVTASEKAHGTATLVSLDMANDELLVSSKGFGAKRLAIKEDVNNLYWRAIRVHGIEEKLRAMAIKLGAVRLGLFGETFGTGVQDLTYGVPSRNEPGFAAFDAQVETHSGTGRWLNQDELRELCAEVGIAVMPTLYAGPYDYDRLAQLAEGTETISGRSLHLREGLVVRPQRERYSEILGGRAIAKFVSAAYLTRKGNVTEFE